jgi:hypothetical protein
MAGEQKTSTLELKTEAPLYFCSKPKMVTVLAATLRPNGHNLILPSLSVIEMPFCSICLVKSIFQIREQEKRSGLEVTMGRFSVKLSWVHGKSHLMLRIIAGQMQIMIVIEYHSIKMAKICSQIRWTDGSQ